jgi:hypothetical protein
MNYHFGHYLDTDILILVLMAAVLLLIVVRGNPRRSSLRILRLVYSTPGLSDEELHAEMMKRSWPVRWLKLPARFHMLFCMPHVINFDNDMADLENLGLIRWEGEDPNYKYFPPNLPLKIT